MEKKWIPASQAAVLAGVTAETIRNLCKSGVIAYKKRHTQFYVDAADVSRYEEDMFQVYESISNFEAYMQHMQEEQAKKLEELRQEELVAIARVEAAKAAAEIEENRPHRAKVLHQFITALLRHLSETDELTPREIEIAYFMLRGYSVTELSKVLYITPTRVNQVWKKIIRKMLRIKRGLIDSERRIDTLTKSITRLKELLPKNCGIFAIKLADEDISVRALHCLRSANIITIGDLVTKHRTDLQNIRHMGKKSIIELEEFLARRGLRLGMNILN